MTRDFATVKDQLLRQLANGGAPVVEVVDKNFKNRGELYLSHNWDNHDLRGDWAMATLESLEVMWKRPVHLESRMEGKVVRYSCEQGETSVQVLGDATDE